MKPLSQRVLDIPRSGIRAVMDVAERLGDVIHLEVGEPHFQPPAHIIEAVAQAARSGFNKYTPNAGLAHVREALTDKLRRENGIPATADTVVMTPGGVFAAACALLTVAESGDEVLLPEPSWPNYSFQLALIGATPVYYRLHEASGFLPDFCEMEAQVTRRTKAILVNSPSNPTGAVFPRETVEDLLAFARRHDLYVISDEVYEKVIYEGRHYSPAALDDEGRVISCFSFSKTYAMTGWRIGYVVAGAELCDHFARLQEATVACPSSLSQQGALAAVTGPQDFVAEMVATYRRNRDLACGLFREAGIEVVEPRGAFYLMADVSGCAAAGAATSEAFVRRLLEAKRVAVAPGSTFGPHCGNYVRISFCKQEAAVVEGVQRIISFLKGE